MDNSVHSISFRAHHFKGRGRRLLMRTRAQALWKALRAWLRQRRQRRRTSLVAPAASATAAREVKNPLRLDDEEYLRVMRDLDEVLSAETPENSSL